jgi:RimJ/RimL family protein N-acetyltransferase
LRRGSLAAAESALLIYRAAFDLLNLRTVYCVTVADNQAVLSFHDSCGLQRVELLRARFTLADGVHDGVKHACTREDWPALRARLEPHARRVAQRLSRFP